MARSNSKAKQVEKRLREIALAYPGAREEFPWGERVVKVGKKVFVFMGMPEGGGLGLSVKLPRQRHDGADVPVRDADRLRPGQERLGVGALRTG